MQNSIKKIETYRSGIFILQLGIDINRLQPLIDKLAYGQRLFTSLPLLPDIALKLEKETLLASIQGTDTIEGGTLTEAEILQIIEAVEPATHEEHQQRISNLSHAYQFAEQTALIQQPIFPVSETFILKLHSLISQQLNDERYCPGQYRDNPKGKITKVGNAEHGGSYKPPQAHIDIKRLMGELVDWLNSEALTQLPSPIRAALAHYYFERIHPFQDGNGRVGRLLEKSILIADNQRFASKGLDYYYLNHIDRYFELFNQARRQEHTSPTCNQDFVEFVIQGLITSIERLHHRANGLMAQFLTLVWLGDLLKRKQINNRQHAILDYLSRQATPQEPSTLKKQAWYQALYHRYSAATESRDWTDLANQGLIDKHPNGALSIDLFKS